MYGDGDENYRNNSWKESNGVVVVVDRRHPCEHENDRLLERRMVRLT